MPNLRSLLSGLVRHRSHRGENAGEGGPLPNAAPEILTGAASGNGETLTARTTVEAEHRLEGNLSTSIVHDVLVNAGVNLEGHEMQVVVGQPRLLNSTMVPSENGRFIDREEEIEVRVVIRTRQRLALFVEALAGASVEGANLTLTPTTSTPPKVTTTVERTPGGVSSETVTVGGGSGT